MGYIRLISVNIDGKELDRTFHIQELKKDFFGEECIYVPANDDPINLVELDGEDVTDLIERTLYDNMLVFIDVVKYLGWE